MIDVTFLYPYHPILNIFLPYEFLNIWETYSKLYLLLFYYILGRIIYQRGDDIWIYSGIIYLKLIPSPMVYCDKAGYFLIFFKPLHRIFLF